MAESSAAATGPGEVPELGLPVSGTSHDHNQGGTSGISMKMFTPRQQPSAMRSTTSSRRTPITRSGVPAAKTAQTTSHPSPSAAAAGSGSTAAARAIPATWARTNTAHSTPGSACSVPLSAAKAEGTLPSAAVSPSVSGQGPIMITTQHTPRLIKKSPPIAQAFSAPPHARRLRSTAPFVAAAPGRHTSGGVHGARADSDERSAVSGSHTHGWGDHMRPPARTTTAVLRPAAAPTPAREGPGSSASTLSPPAPSDSPATHADPSAPLASAAVVRPAHATPPKHTPSVNGNGVSALCVHPPQQTTNLPPTTAGGASGHGVGHDHATRATHRGAENAAALSSAGSPMSSRRAIASRSAVALSGGRGGSVVRPVGSVRAGSTTAQTASGQGQALHMADLVRPSEAYKVKLTPTAQQRTVARRSRQPRKILNACLTKYPVIRRVAEVMGFDVEETEEELNAYQFNLCWSDTVLPLVRLVRLGNWQRTNHFPSMYLLCRKLHLATTLGRMQRRLPQDFHFFPTTWSLRSERAQFTRYLAALRQKHLVKYFIVKPNAGCQGRGIQVTRDPLSCVEDPENFIVQEYIPRPLLIDDRKFDLRVYVLLTSIREPSIFMYNDGLVRMCAEVYEAPNDSNVKNTCKHLTNYAVNKRSPEFVYNTDAARGDIGNKRNFRFFNRWLTERGESPQSFWQQVGFVIVKTILSAQPHIGMVYNSCFPRFNEGHTCFEILGFDILVDHKMKPWLMEVNHTPSFATDTPLDDEIKTGVLTEAWDIVDCKATDYERDRQRERHDFAARNMRSSTGQMPSARLRRPAGMVSATDEGPAPPEDDEQAEARTRAADEQLLAARMHEDSKLKNYMRIFPTDVPEFDQVYRNVRHLAEADACSRATNGSLFVNGVTGPVLSAHAINSTASPVSSPSAADTYRFPQHGRGEHTRTTSTSTAVSTEANGAGSPVLSSAPVRIAVASTAAPAGAVGQRPSASPATRSELPATASSVPPPPTRPSQSDSYKQLEQEMHRVRRRASHDALNGSRTRSLPSSHKTPDGAAQTAHAPAEVNRTAANRADGCEGTDAGVDGRGNSIASPAPQSPSAVVDPAQCRARTATGASNGAPVSTPASVAPLRTEKKMPPGEASTGLARAAAVTKDVPHALSSASPLAEGGKVAAARASHPSSRPNSAGNTPTRGAKRSGPSTPLGGPSRASPSAVAKGVSPEDLRRLASLQEQLERAEEAEPENHESDESFDLDE